MNLSYTIIWDNREQKPLVFPATLITLDDTKTPTARTPHTTIVLHNRKECLNSIHPQMQKGDYFLDGYPDRCVVERKASLVEIARNCLYRRPRKRFIFELDYLRAKCLFPALLLIGTPGSYMQKQRIRTRATKKPGAAYAALIRLLMERNIWLLTMPGETLCDRQAMGECVAHILISGAVTNEVPRTRTPNITRKADVPREQDA